MWNEPLCIGADMSPSSSLHPFLLLFDDVYDPREPHPTNLLHECRDVLAIALLASLCGMRDYLEFQDWGDENLLWLKDLLELPYGIPSESCFRRVFEAIDPDEMRDLLEKSASWCGKGWVAVDGKASRGARLDELNGRALMMLNAFASDQNLMLSSMAIEPGSNEPGSLPAFLSTLPLQGCAVTLDAGGSTRPVVRTLLQTGADYLVSIKGNQEQTQVALREHFEWALDPERPADQSTSWVEVRDVDKGHGRIEERELYVTQELDALRVLDEPWEGVCSLLYQRTTRTQGEHTSTSERYFLSSKPCGTPEQARELLEAIRGHWSVESRGHWNLDVSFGEDANQVRSKRGATNLSMMRKTAMNMLRRDTETPKRVSLKRRMLKCQMNRTYLFKILKLNELTSHSVP